MMYAMPYEGSFDQEYDYTPYTTCGVRQIGYSVYKNSVGTDHIEFDASDVAKKGYVEVTSTESLWRNTNGQALYITILVGQSAYVATLVGNGTLSMGVLMAISTGVTIIIAVCLIGVFWGMFIRVKRLQARGYKPVVA